MKRRKQPEIELMVSLAKHQSVLLVCFNRSYSYFEKGCRKKCARDNPER